jgi:hypothetical protein
MFFTSLELFGRLPESCTDSVYCNRLFAVFLGAQIPLFPTSNVATADDRKTVMKNPEHKTELLIGEGPSSPHSETLCICVYSRCQHASRAKSFMLMRWRVIIAQTNWRIEWQTSGLLNRSLIILLLALFGA